MDNWLWPQYLLAGWWACTMLVALALMMVPSVKVDTQKLAFRIIDISVLAFVLYAGGFW